MDAQGQRGHLQVERPLWQCHAKGHGKAHICFNKVPRCCISWVKGHFESYLIDIQKKTGEGGHL